MSRVTIRQGEKGTKELIPRVGVAYTGVEWSIFGEALCSSSFG
jgi:hypothetical protein